VHWEREPGELAPVTGWTEPVRPPPPAPTSRPLTSHPISAPGPLPTAPDPDLPRPRYSGPDLATGPVTITDPRWAREPLELERCYPARALQRGIEGQAVLQCDVSETGMLSCVVISENPARWGFGDAALRISREYAMVPAMANGVPTPGRYRMVVPFDIR